MLGTLVRLVLSVSVASSWPRASRSDLASASLLMVTVRPVGLLREAEAGPDTARGCARERRPALRPVQRMKEASRCQEKKRPGRGWAEAARLVWRVQEPWARLRLERQREVTAMEAGASRRARLTRRLTSTVTSIRGSWPRPGSTNSSVRNPRARARLSVCLGSRDLASEGNVRVMYIV